jgi:hypothetical protein
MTDIKSLKITVIDRKIKGSFKKDVCRLSLVNAREKNKRREPI